MGKKIEWQLASSFHGCAPSLLEYSGLFGFWKERNGKIFRASVASLEDILNELSVRTGKRVILRKEFQNLNFDLILRKGLLANEGKKIRNAVPSNWGTRLSPQFQRQDIVPFFLSLLGVGDSKEAEVMTMLEALRIYVISFQDSLIV